MSGLHHVGINLAVVGLQRGKGVGYTEPDAQTVHDTQTIQRNLNVWGLGAWAVVRQAMTDYASSIPVVHMGPDSPSPRQNAQLPAWWVPPAKRVILASEDASSIKVSNMDHGSLPAPDAQLPAWLVLPASRVMLASDDTSSIKACTWIQGPLPTTDAPSSLVGASSIKGHIR